MLLQNSQTSKEIPKVDYILVSMWTKMKKIKVLSIIIPTLMLWKQNEKIETLEQLRNQQTTKKTKPKS